MNNTKLRSAIEQHFSGEELRTICFDLGIDYDDDLKGNTKSAKIVSLLEYSFNRNLHSELISILKRERSFLDWLALIQNEEQIVKNGNQPNNQQDPPELIERVLRIKNLLLILTSVIVIIAIYIWFSSDGGLLPSANSTPTVSSQQHMYVLDYANPSLHELTLAGVYIRKIAEGSPAELTDPAAIAIGLGSDVFIGNFDFSVTAKYDLDTERWRTTINSGELEELTELHYHQNGSLYALSNDTEVLIIMDPDTGNIVANAENECLHFPTSLAVTDDGSIYVGNDDGSICQYTEFGKLENRLQISSRIDGIALDVDDNIYVSNYLAGKIFRYNGKMSRLTEFAVQIENPSELRFDSEGNLYAVTSRGIEAWAPNGEYIGMIVLNGEYIDQVRTFKFALPNFN